MTIMEVSDQSEQSEQSDNQKRENLLNLALSATEEERKKSESLEVGFDPRDKTWELIIRYNGDRQKLGARLEALGVGARFLINTYAVLRVPEGAIPQISALEQIEYIEKPKRLFFASDRARAASCLLSVQPGIGGGGNHGTGSRGLTGKGVLVAVIDSGIDYFHPDFRREDGTTRIRFLWDQNQDRIYDSSEINESLKAGQTGQPLSADLSGHGTAVAAIAAGNGRGSQGVYRGVAYESDLIIVKLGTPPADSFPRTTQLMEALDFTVRKALELAQPVAVNISFGNTYGSHDGTSLLETFMDDIAGYGRSVLVAGTGNEGTGAGHAMGMLEPGQDQEVQLSIAPYETGLGVQLWKSYTDRIAASLITPSGRVLGPLKEQLGPQTFQDNGTRILVYYGEPSPYTTAQELYFDLIPREDYIDSGIWTFRLHPEQVVTRRYDLWLPSRGILNPATRFLSPSPETTLTIPSTAASVLSVGAYDDSRRSYADFSGRGFTRRTDQVKPDLTAPGVDIVTARRGGGYEAVTGTSFAAPFVTGSAALLMQWGILEGNDPFLYGEKVKAYLIRGARRLPGGGLYPNRMVGDYGIIVSGQRLPGTE